MRMSTEINEIAKAINEAQKSMGAAKKGSANPFFRSSYADLNSVLQACKDALNDQGITILQPHVTEGEGEAQTHYVETVLLHKSGQFLASRTKIEVAKKNDPQALGSSISYSRRYGLQSFISLPAEDDDGEKAMNRKGTSFSKKSDKQKVEAKSESKSTASKTSGTSTRPSFRRKKKDL